jgi:hypothetical protein
MVCLRNISVDTLHKGDTEDNNNNNNKNNQNADTNVHISSAVTMSIQQDIMYKKCYVSSATELNYILLKFSRRTQHYSCHPRLPTNKPFNNTTADIQAFYKIHHLQDLTNPSTHYATLVTSTHQWIERSSFQHKD